MPITAKLSRRFYERLGDQIANELVDWLNVVDSSVRDELNTLNERNWLRLHAELDARDARLDARLSQLEAKLLRWMFAFWVSTVLAIAGLKLI